MKTKQMGICSFLLLWLSLSAYADVEVEFIAPQLGDGMANIEAMIEDQALSFTDDLAIMLNQTIEKPKFLQGFFGAATTNAITQAGLFPDIGYAIFLGSQASIRSESFSAETWEQLSQLQADDDLDMGACVEPLSLRFMLPLDKLLKGLSAGLSIGYMDINSTYGLYSLSGYGLVAWRYGSPSRAPFSWDGLRVEMGGGVAQNRISATIQTATITQVLPVDIDGSNGPLVPFDVSFSVEPDINLGIETLVYSGHLQVSSGISLFRAISLSLGAGLAYSFGHSSISLSADEDILVGGYFSDYIEENASVRISGSIGGTDSQSLSAYLCGSLAYRLGNFSINLPIVWNIPNSFGLALSLGLGW